MTAHGVAKRGPSAPVPPQNDGATFETDVVIVGAGGAGLTTALFSRWQGDEVTVLEKAPAVGGTAAKSGFGIWIPNNRYLREQGIVDSREDYLRFVARVSRPERYEPESPTFGLDAWEFDMVSAVYETASTALDLLTEKAGVRFEVHRTLSPEYYGHLDESVVEWGRSLSPVGSAGLAGGGGRVVVDQLVDVASDAGVLIVTDRRVQRVIVRDGEVVGVEATDSHNHLYRILARKAVVFSSGGFSRNSDLRSTFLPVPSFSGCAAPTNEGDFVRIAAHLGAELCNMNSMWACPVPLEKVLTCPDEVVGMFQLPGDSMILVNKHGRRATNEKLPYNELAQAFYGWDPMAVEYANLILIQVWDERSQRHSSGVKGGLIVGPGEDDAHVIVGESLEALADEIATRLARYAGETGGFRLGEDFLPNLMRTVERFNELAEKGHDDDFGRGSAAIQRALNGPVREEQGRTNPTMWPISGQGPYYAALVTAGSLDTKGGPRTNTEGQVLDDSGEPIPGLYGVGNCVASASGRGYWGAGATLGPIIAFSYRTAQAAHRESSRSAFGQSAGKVS